AGLGLAEAMDRAGRYHEAGADAILIHSKISTADQVISFKREWGDRSPVIIVPTMYHETPTPTFEREGFSVAIWANQILRASIATMQKTAGSIQALQSISSTESQIVPVEEIFRLQNAGELREAERRYLPRAGASEIARERELGDPSAQP
ncbi:MAG: phosphoenolpyruvate mutase, partial [Gemmatimonadetes bacterium]|nr:phosphoenolpyruvate mutase [Gemmatimonadota bacterium]